MTDKDLHGFLTAFRDIADLAFRTERDSGAPGLVETLQAHLGQSPRDLPVVEENVRNHRYADWDQALAMLSARDPGAREVGIAGEGRFHRKLTDFAGDARQSTAQVEYASVPVGPDRHRQALGFGIRLFRYRGEPVTVLQRRADPQFGGEAAKIEVLCADRDLSTTLLDEARELALTHSVLRGQVVSFQATGFGAEAEGITFLERPDISAAEVILPEAAMERIVAHVNGIADHAEMLRRNGQHLKRGLLLYGPPGTGKTHTVRHLIGRNPGHTVVLLAGESLAYVSLAASLARALQPAIVVLEDCDLVAEDRGMSPTGRPLLFDVLDAMDGLDADADVTFLLTTNRVETLERALVQRPGRVDLAVEIPLPDEDGRRRLLDLYRGPVTYGPAALAVAAERSEGMTASSIKELMRRAVLRAALAGDQPGDAHLLGALGQLLAGQEELTRVLLGEGAMDPEPLVAYAEPGWDSSAE